jgi:hypothetical protein
MAHSARRDKSIACWGKIAQNWPGQMLKRDLNFPATALRRALALQYPLYGVFYGKIKG